MVRVGVRVRIEVRVAYLSVVRVRVVAPARAAALSLLNALSYLVCDAEVADSTLVDPRPPGAPIVSRSGSYMFARARDLALAVLTPSGLDASASHPVARLGVHVSNEVSTCSPRATL